jgi:putative hemolysin
VDPRGGAFRPMTPQAVVGYGPVRVSGAMAMDNACGGAPFRLSPAAFRWLPRFAADALRSFCDRVLALPALNAVYRQTQDAPSTVPFCERALRALGVQIGVDAEDLQQVPTTGPLIAVANHPFGGLDGLILVALLQRVRPDVRLLANYLLDCIPEVHAFCFFVDPFGGPGAGRRNRAAMKSAVRWVQDGGALGVFPAGEVSHFTLRRGFVTDPPWNDAVSRLIQRARAPVLPVYFGGANSCLFQAAGLLHPRVRTVLLPRELLRSRGRMVRVEIGSPIPFGRMPRFVSARGGQCRGGGDLAPMTDYLRFRTYILSGRRAPPRPPVGRTRVERTAPLIDAVSRSVLAAEIAALPAAQCLCETGALCVVYGRAQELPGVLREIGRLRETTFRRVGEGTGRPIDLDRFDEHYLHLFAWDAQAERIVGAYRLGPTDLLLKRFGPGGLYTSTLFRYRPRLLEQLNPALELGRSFVIPECQRDYAPLMLLWKGIGHFVALHPRYRRLFGAVSISDEFHSMTKQLLMAFLRLHRLDEGLAAMVRPRNPPKAPRFRAADERRLATLVSDVADVEQLVGEIESNRRGLPVLLRQYLKLNAKLLGFNIDPDFGGVLDGLLFVDLTTVPVPILRRYMGRDAAAAFLAFHGVCTQALRPGGQPANVNLTAG